jgi:FkbM family methyltransferase
MIVDYVFMLRKISKPSYIDIGAHHPTYLSNTAHFYAKGCRGVNIEANPLLIEAFNKERKNDINLNIGVGSADGELEFYVMKDSTLSTFSKAEADSMVALGNPLSEVRKVKLVTVQQVLDRYCNSVFPDFLSLDAEGMDLEILKSIAFEKSRPKVICVEAAEYSPIGAGTRRNDLIDFLVGQDYYEYANTNLNAIMVDRAFWFI